MRYFWGFGICLCLLAGCAGEENGAITLNNDPASLADAVILDQAAILRQAQPAASPGLAELVASVLSPEVNGQPVSANHILLQDHFAYVSYHTQGENYGGGVEIVDLAQPDNPELISQLLFERLDINTSEIAPDGQTLWLGGSSAAAGAVIVRVALDNGLLSRDVEIVPLAGPYDVNSLEYTAAGLYVSAGNSNGGLWWLDSDLQIIDHEHFANSKYVATNGQSLGRQLVALESGNPSKIHIYTVGAPLSQSQVKVIEAIEHQEVAAPDSGKAVVFMKENDSTCYVSLGRHGLKAYNINNGKLVYVAPNSSMLTTGNTNAVSADSQYVYLANGADGVAFLSYPPPDRNGKNIELGLVTVWDEAAVPASANFIVNDENFIFVAKGAAGGLKILRK
jgi:hypothetical protein